MTVLTAPSVSPVAPATPTPTPSGQGCAYRFFSFMGCLIKGLGLSLVALLLLVVALVGLYLLIGMFIGSPVVAPAAPTAISQPEAPAAPTAISQPEAPAAPTAISQPEVPAAPVVTTTFADAYQFFLWAKQQEGWLATVDWLNSVTDGKVTFAENSEIPAGSLIWCTIPQENLGNVTLLQGEGTSGVFGVNSAFTLSVGQCGSNVRFLGGWPQ